MKILLKEYFSVKGTRRQILLALVASTITALISARIENVLSLKNKGCA